MIGDSLRAEMFFGQDPYLDATNTDPFYPHTHLTPEVVEWSFNETDCKFWVEAGTMLGGSALLVAETAKRLGKEIAVLCIDPFTGDVNMWDWERGLATNNRWRFLRLVNGAPTIRQRFLANVVSAGFEQTIIPMQATSIVGLRYLERLIQRNIVPRPDVVYVDSAHEEGETLIELRTAWSVLRPGGLLLGDDLDWAAVRRDVERFSGETDGSVLTFGNQWAIRRRD